MLSCPCAAGVAKLGDELNESCVAGSISQMKIDEIVTGSLTDLKVRWKKARCRAFKDIRPLNSSEEELLSRISNFPDLDFERILNNVFLNSQKLGRSYQKAFGITWERQDFVRYLAELDSPCGKGNWSEFIDASSLVRSGCTGGKTHGSRFCRYWREAFDGLVTGLSEKERFVRHQSIMAGDAECLDIIYTECADTSTTVWENQNKWGLIPREIVSDLSKVEQKFRQMGAEIKFLGVRERILYYRIDSIGGKTCGGGISVVRTFLEKTLKDLFPEFTPQDASPVAVYGDKS